MNAQELREEIKEIQKHYRAFPNLNAFILKYEKSILMQIENDNNAPIEARKTARKKIEKDIYWEIRSYFRENKISTLGMSGDYEDFRDVPICYKKKTGWHLDEALQHINETKMFGSEFTAENLIDVLLGKVKSIEDIEEYEEEPIEDWFDMRENRESISNIFERISQ